MRTKQPALIITFPTTTAAMAAEHFSLAQGLPGRIIPMPREITAGCGLVWKAPPESRELILQAWLTAGLDWSAMMEIDV